MIITEIVGGLGNQMFQYAAGCALAKRTGTELKLDNRLFLGYTLHNGFELERVFEIDSPSASLMEINNLIGWRSSRIGRRFIRDRRLSFLKGKHYYVEDSTIFNEEILSLRDSYYLSGYWQSERYFEDQISLIRKQFRFKQPLEGMNKKYVKMISSSNAISIHVRRGDYVSNPNTNSMHGTCSISYYEKAMRYIEKRVEDPVYFIFSDDVKWVRDNLSFNVKCYYIDHNSGLESYNDMRLMSLCDHNIIANSSFSWWGAWLNPDSEKIIVAPNQWFQNPGRNTSHLVPENWIRV